MKEQIEQLIEDYKRRLATAENMIKVSAVANQWQRLGTKASCYRTFITELERINSEDSITNLENLL